MGLSLTEALDNLYTTTWQHMLSTVRDQIFDATPFWFWMRDKGQIQSTIGGRFLTEPLQFAKLENIKWIGKGGTTSLNDNEFLTIAQYQWRYLVGSIVRFLVDDQQNRGNRQIIDFMTAKLSNLQNGLADELEQALFGAAGSSRPGDQPGIDGLQLLVADDPTAAVTLGEIDPSTNTWWRNQFKDMSSSSFTSNGVKEMRTMLNDCSQNLSMDMPDIIVSDQNTYELYEETIFANHFRTQNNKLAEAGFANQTFKGLPMIWSPQATQRMYFLNTNFIKFKYDPMLFFDMTEWKPIPDQPGDRAAQVVLAASFTMARRRTHGVIFDIDTD